MMIIGWSLFLALLLMRLRLGKLALGLLSGLALSLVTFSGYMIPAAPPYHLMLIQATWVICMATLEVAGLFYFLETKCKLLLYSPWPVKIAICFCVTFFTGSMGCVYAIMQHHTAPQTGRLPRRLLLPLAMATQMLSLVSPLSLSGILLVLVLHRGALSVLGLVGMIACVSAGIMLVGSIIALIVPYAWYVACCRWFKFYKATEEIDRERGQLKPQVHNSIVGVLVLILSMEALFLFAQTTLDGYTALPLIRRVFPVAVPLFFALVMLSVAAITLLSLRLKPADLLLSDRFKLGIEQFFIFLGLAWFMDTLISNDEGLWIRLWHNAILYGHNLELPPLYAVYSYRLMVFLSLCLVDIQMVVWLFIPLLPMHCCSALHLTLCLCCLYGLAPIRYGLNRIVAPTQPRDGVWKQDVASKAVKSQH